MSTITTKYSIITPVYNVLPYLNDMLESVRRQTYIGWEHIIVDDGSTDGSAEFLDYYASKDSRIKVIHQKNSGVGVARNVGLRIATGEWVLFIDADDIVRKDYLQTVESCSKIYGKADVVKILKYDFPDGKLIKWGECNKYSCKMVDIRSHLPESLIFSGFFEFVVRHEIIHGIEFGPYCTGEDRLYLSKVLTKASYVLSVDYMAYAYRLRTGSAMNSPPTRIKLEHRIGYSLEWIEVFAGSGKQIPQSFYRLAFNNLTENFIYDIYRVPVEERSILWGKWYEMLKSLYRYKQHFSLWSKFVIFICLKLKKHWIANSLCRFPRIMKNKGLHRGVLKQKIRRILCKEKQCAF